MPRVAAMICALAVALAAGGCAGVPQDPASRAAYLETNDPLEPLNRGIFEVNRVVDKLIFRPVAQVYRWALPPIVRTSVRNMLDNMGEPVVIANNLLQGEFDRAGVAWNRFLFNSTVGIGGIMDFAGEHGLPKQTGDFGQTLYSWGVSDGFYLVLPILGPSNPRDGVGMAVDSFIDPFRYLLTRTDPDASVLEDPNVIRTAVDGIDKRASSIDELDAIEKTAIDFYAQIRSLFRQNRAKELRHGILAPTSPATDLYEDPAKSKTPE
jgi:phospholipid-binding lipoprotein MlaA